MNDTVPLALMTVCIALPAVFWVLYLIRIVLQDDEVKEYHRAMRRKQEEARREEDDRARKKGDRLSTMKQISQSMVPGNTPKKDD